LGCSILNMEIRDGGIDYREIHLFHFTGSNADVPAITIRILQARVFGEPNGRWAGSFYRASKGEFSGTVEIVSYLHV